MKKFTVTAFCYVLFVAMTLWGQASGTNLQPKAGAPQEKLAPPNMNAMYNQMMLIIMERLKAGNVKEAQDIALKLIAGHEKFVDTPQEVFRSFSTIMEQRLYETLQAQEGNKAKVTVVPQPIADGFYFLAMIDFHQGRVEKALENMQKAIQWNPVHAAFFVERGFMILHQSNPPDFAQAQVAYLRALELADTYEDFASAMRGIGFILVDKGDYEGALACYLRAKMYDPEDKVAEKEIAFIRGQSPFLPKDLDGTKAVPLLLNRRIPAGINPLHVNVLLSLADTLSSAAQKKELTALLKRAQRMDPQNESIKKRLGALK